MGVLKEVGKRAPEQYLAPPMECPECGGYLLIDGIHQKLLSNPFNPRHVLRYWCSKCYKLWESEE